MVFGSKESTATLLLATESPHYKTQQLLLELSTSEHVTADLNPEAIDRAWERVRAHAARCIVAWAQMFPEREFISSLRLLDFDCQWGLQLPERIIESCIASMAASVYANPARLHKEWRDMAENLACSAPDYKTLTTDEGEAWLLKYVRERLDVIYPPLQTAILRQFIFSKSSAALERDFKAMRLI